MGNIGDHSRWKPEQLRNLKIKKCGICGTEVFKAERGDCKGTMLFDAKPVTVWTIPRADCYWEPLCEEPMCFEEEVLLKHRCSRRKKRG